MKLNTWTFQFLFLIGRILIKTILRQIHVCVFLALSTPAKVIKEIEKLQNFSSGESTVGKKNDRRWLGKQLASQSWREEFDRGNFGSSIKFCGKTIRCGFNKKITLQLWTGKYRCTWEDLSRVDYLPIGSFIWNSGKQSLQLVQEHCFQELIWGKFSLLWED